MACINKPVFCCCWQLYRCILFLLLPPCCCLLSDRFDIANCKRRELRLKVDFLEKIVTDRTSSILMIHRSAFFFPSEHTLQVSLVSSVSFITTLKAVVLESKLVSPFLILH